MSDNTSIARNFIILTDKNAADSGGSDFFLRGVGSSRTFDIANLWSDISFSTNNNALVPYERMRIAANGSIGINTTSPAYLFDINGILSNRGGNSSTTGFVNLMQGDSTHTGFLEFRNSNASRQAYIGYGGSSDFYLWNEEERNMLFATNNLERMRINSNGIIQMGLSIPQEQPGVTFSERFKWGNVGSQGYSYISAGMNSIAGPFGLGGILNFGTKVGNANSYGGVFLTNGNTSFSTFSDIRLKENINSLENNLDKILELNPVSYSIKSDTTHTIKHGLIAQEVINIIPQVVDETGTEKTLSIRYTELIPTLIGAIKELKAELEELKNKCINI